MQAVVTMQQTGNGSEWSVVAKEEEWDELRVLFHGNNNDTNYETKVSDKMTVDNDEDIGRHDNSDNSNINDLNNKQIKEKQNSDRDRHRTDQNRETHKQADRQKRTKKAKENEETAQKWYETDWKLCKGLTMEKQSDIKDRGKESERPI